MGTPWTGFADMVIKYFFLRIWYLWPYLIADMGTPRTVLRIWLPPLADMGYFGTPSCGYERPS